MSESASTKGQNLILDIPEGKMEHRGDDSARTNIPLSPTLIGVISKGKSSMDSLIPKLCLQNTTSEPPSEVFDPRIKRTLSQPETTIAFSNPHSSHGGFNSAIEGAEHPLHRSKSVPNLGKLYRVIPFTTQITDAAPSVGKDRRNDLGEDITEDAVCRICLIELEEGSSTLKMECSCKGELALAHQECAVKWFTLKGNNLCDICRKEVLNLPVTLIRINRAAQNQRSLIRAWKRLPFFLFSMFAYFIFLEELLARRGSRCPLSTIPFSLMLGIVAHMIAIVIARKYSWIYAVVQFGLVVLSGHILYMRLNFDSFTATLSAVLVGFGLAMAGYMILNDFIKWIRRCLTRSNQQPNSQEVMQPNQS